MVAITLPDGSVRNFEGSVTGAELAADIGERGMVIAGGGALIRDMDRRLMQETGLPVVVADDPLTCVARGCGRALEDMAVLGDVFTRE